MKVIFEFFVSSPVRRPTTIMIIVSIFCVSLSTVILASIAVIATSSMMVMNGFLMMMVTVFSVAPVFKMPVISFNWRSFPGIAGSVWASIRTSVKIIRMPSSVLRMWPVFITMTFTVRSFSILLVVRINLAHIFSLSCLWNQEGLNITLF